MEESSLTFSEVSTQGGNFSTAMGDGDLRALPVGDVNSGNLLSAEQLGETVELFADSSSKQGSIRFLAWLDGAASERGSH